VHLSVEDSTKFKRLKIKEPLELAILAPHKYEDRRLKNSIELDRDQAIDVSIKSIHKGATLTTIELYSHNLEIDLEALLFNPKPYMLRSFVVGSRAIYYGRIGLTYGKYQIAHPQLLKEHGSIVAKYKSALRSDALSRLIKKHITREYLNLEKLPSKIVDTLLNIHFALSMPSDEHTSDELYALKYTELFIYLRALKRSRRYYDAVALNSPWREWAKRLPFKLTDEQLSTIVQIEQDLSRSVAAKRMVVGDVGSGKTMVMLASALMAQPHRSIILAPTTLLANQLYEEAQTYLIDLKITLVTSKSSKNSSLQSSDLIIGTHALLYKELPQTALIMVDEQHRFGTAQRNKLNTLVSDGSLRAHYLQFSATPIPRTQAMIDSAYIDVSLITTTPFQRDIETSIIHRSDFTALLKHIEIEISQHRQVLLIYPLVDASDALEYMSLNEAAEFWQSRFKHVHITHGKDRDKEQVLEEFRDSGELLLATTVVEVGISLPRLSTVVIVGAERLGLATLHQLRGRVSRNGLKGYCYLYTNLKQSSRLEEFVKTKSGFDIATLDLRYRQSGDIVGGSIQSGKKFLWADLSEDEQIVASLLERIKGIA